MKKRPVAHQQGIDPRPVTYQTGTLHFTYTNNKHSCVNQSPD